MTLLASRVLSRRLFCSVPLLAAAGSLRAEPATVATAWPRRTVRLVTRPVIGARSDALARTLAAAMARRWREPVIVDYRGGGEGTAPVEAFLAAHDDHALLLNPIDIWSTLPLVHNSLSFDPAHELVPLAPVVQDFIAIGAASKLGLASLDAMIEAAHRRPGTLTWACAAHAPYLAFSAFLKATAIDLTFVPCRNPTASLADLAEERVDLAVLPLPPAIGLAQAGRIRLLAVASADRAPGAPAVPTVGEAGFPSLAMFSGHSLFGLRDMPAPVRARIADDVAVTLRDPVVAERLTRMGYRPQLEPLETAQLH